MAVTVDDKKKKFKAFKAYCLHHGNLTVTSLDDVKTEHAEGPTGGGYMRAYVICPRCPEGSVVAKVNVPEKLRLDLINMKK